jgi:hypothetical protein
MTPQLSWSYLMPLAAALECQLEGPNPPECQCAAEAPNYHDGRVPVAWLQYPPGAPRGGRPGPRAPSRGSARAESAACQ